MKKTLTISDAEVRQAVAYWMEKEFSLTVKPEQLKATYSNFDYSEREFTGLEVVEEITKGTP